MSGLKPAKEVVILKPITEQKIGNVSINLKQSLTNIGGERMPEVGEIVAIGEGESPVKLKIGDIVYYEKFLDNTIPFEGETFNFVRFNKILAVREK